MADLDVMLKGFLEGLDNELELVARDPKAYADGFVKEGGNPITLGPPVISAEEWAESQIEGATRASGKWLAHSLRPRRVPSQAALAADAKRRERLEAAEKAKRWQSSMASVNEDERLVTIENVGESGFKAGINSRAHKIRRVTGALQPMVTALKEQIGKLPQDTEEQREAKMIAAKRGMQALKGRARKA